jgi:hypothetical protein
MGGVGLLSLSNESDRERRRKSDESSQAEPVAKPGQKRAGTSQVGDALRTVYQRAIDEDIPPEMLDLLGKLG